MSRSIIRLNHAGGKDQVGVIEEVLPREMYRVRLSDGRTVRAGISVRGRHGMVRLIVGCQVRVKISEYDAQRAQIVGNV